MYARILAAAALIAVAVPAQAATEPTAADRAAIAAIIAAEAAAWARGDATAYAAVMAPDVVFTNIIGMFAVGRAPFEAQHARIFATVYKGSTLHQSIEHIAMIRPDVAVVDVVASLTGYASLPPGIVADNNVLRARLEQVMVRDAGRWSVAAYHNVAINPVALANRPPPPK